MKGMRAPRTPNENLRAEKARLGRVLEHNKHLDAGRPSRTRERDRQDMTKQNFSTDFRLPYCRV